MSSISETIETKKDYSSDLLGFVAAAEAMENIDDAVAHLLVLEKLCRTNNDFTTLKKICVAVVKLCRDRQDWARVNSSLNIINKRRSQSKHAVTAIVTEGMTYLADCPTKEIRVDLIKALKDVCDTKIYVEGESAKLHMMLAHIYEQDGDVSKACEEIQDMHVETYGSLSKLEKCAYINEQVRLNLRNKDYIRACIHSRKMNRKTVDEKAFADVKLGYYTLMIEYHLHERELRDLASCFEKLFEINSDSTFEDATRWQTAISSLEAAVIFFVLSPHSSDRTASLSKILTGPSFTKHVDASPLASQLLKIFTTNLVVRDFNSDPIFSHSEVTKFLTSSSDLDFLKESYFTRMIEHNIRVVSVYYSRISLGRLADLVGVPDVDRSVQASASAAASNGSGEGLVDNSSIEDFLARMSHEDTLGADLKIDRPKGIVVFHKRRRKVEEDGSGGPVVTQVSTYKENVDSLENWSADISSILKLVETTCHLIRREYVIHKVNV